VLKGELLSFQESLKLPFVTPKNGRIQYSLVSLPQTPNTQFHIPISAQNNTQKDPPVTGVGSCCYRKPEPQIMNSTPNQHVCQRVESRLFTHITPSFRNTSLPNTPIRFQSGGSVPMPKFNPKLETAEHFLSELEVYMP
jgi:hypothetical protein